MEKNQKIAVIYKTKYGSAKQYAEWIAEETGGDLFEIDHLDPEMLSSYETIVFGGSLYVVGILGLKSLMKQYDQLKGKHLIVFSVGASPEVPEARKDVLQHNFQEEMRGKISFYMLRGAFDYNKLSLGDKALMTMLKTRILSKKEEDRNADEIGMLACFERPESWVDKTAIKPIVEQIFA
jgi:flavodoxin